MRPPAVGPSSNTSYRLGWTLLLGAVIPLQLTLLICGLFVVTADEISLRKLFAIAATIGFIGAAFSIPAAHELLHRPRRAEQFLAITILFCFSYPHFYITHTRGHHRDIGTAHDPSTARLGESFYKFYRRALFDGLSNAWQLERKRVPRSQGILFDFLGNRVIWLGAAVITVYGAIAFLFGAKGVAFFALQSLVGFTSLEIINYIQHYGLIRRRRRNGEYESVKPIHSWNSSHRISNWAFFNLTRHSDHHVSGRRFFHELRQEAQMPQLPFGYFCLFLVVLAPPLWRLIMDDRVAIWRRSYGYAQVDSGDGAMNTPAGNQDTHGARHNKRDGEFTYEGLPLL